ncbi:MAG: hypothetical protein KF901_04375 [Myxococcales bacterium]|nr:hypothetical protein [Myxococcales bacterium]
MRSPRSFAWLLLPLLALAAAPAEAQPGDGAYRRWDAFVGLEVGAGAAASRRQDAWSAGPVVELRARVLDAAGPFVSFGWDADATSALAFGVELRPLWPALFLLDRSTGRERLDLWLQSWSLDLGAALGPLVGEGRGLAMIWGLACDVPLSRPSRSRGAFRGAGLRLFARQTIVRASAPEAPTASMAGWTIGATLRLTLGLGRGLSGGPRWR